MPMMDPRLAQFFQQGGPQGQMPVPPNPGPNVGPAMEADPSMAMGVAPPPEMPLPYAPPPGGPQAQPIPSAGAVPPPTMNLPYGGGGGIPPGPPPGGGAGRGRIPADLAPAVRGGGPGAVTDGDMARGGGLDPQKRKLIEAIMRARGMI